MKFLIHMWLVFLFDSFLSRRIQLQNLNEIFQSTAMKVFKKKKSLPDF